MSLGVRRTPSQSLGREFFEAAKEVTVGNQGETGGSMLTPPLGQWVSTDNEGAFTWGGVGDKRVFS